MRNILTLFTLGILVGCTPATVFVRPGDLSVWFKGRHNLDLSPIITRFEAGKGTGSEYRRNEEVRFNLNLNRNGFVALLAIDPPPGKISWIGVYALREGASVWPPPGSGVLLRLNSPLGLQRVRAIFTERQGTLNQQQDLEIATNTYIRSAGGGSVDVAETYFVVR